MLLTISIGYPFETLISEFSVYINVAVMCCVENRFRVNMLGSLNGYHSVVTLQGLCTRLYNLYYRAKVGK